ncbi:alkane 1-monooxygenase [Nibrella saemangeumensis]|uniref:Alkane 1-monooxygenase n=1 Tax=Nibrella saemangeumensis TaxID=1084526 RepID=A0ABP8ND93_9BACT
MKPLKKFGFLWSYSLLAVIVGSYYLGGPAWTFAGCVYTYGVLPLLDAAFGKDRANVAREDYERVVEDCYFDVLVYSFVYLQYGLLVWGCWMLVFDPMTLKQQVGLMFSIGIFSGTIINIAHELGHRSSRIAQVHAKLALLSVSYMHFLIEHNRGHHVHVATPLDTATARKNQSLYAFWWQTLIGGYCSAWRIEKGLLKKAGHQVWSRQNEMLWFVILPVLLCVVFTTGFSLAAGYIVWIVTVFFVAQCLIGILLLESVNYIEHYGIIRREIAPGKYERVNPLHSWNASQYISNLVLFQLQRHSDHHAYAARPDQVLRHFDESPQLPFGYPLMILMAMLPPLWFRLMNPRLAAWKAKAYSSEEIFKTLRQFA